MVLVKTKELRNISTISLENELKRRQEENRNKRKNHKEL